MAAEARASGMLLGLIELSSEDALRGLPVLSLSSQLLFMRPLPLRALYQGVCAVVPARKMPEEVT